MPTPFISFTVLWCLLCTSVLILVWGTHKKYSVENRKKKQISSCISKSSITVGKLFSKCLVYESLFDTSLWSWNLFLWWASKPRISTTKPFLYELAWVPTRPSSGEGDRHERACTEMWCLPLEPCQSWALSFQDSNPDQPATEFSSIRHAMLL